ncbi:TonB-dependent receptor [Massilia eurypsychrophila]|uniref:TonB-dependent receptor n=1 Tax=Massilia eurypsychrophila TaxID=1485217 RepID=A0A2G8TEL9_9BURK|nr:outer membrane beta-barrel family protein [Massilia eurypsychrophila]PIL44473.1 TonB-dependent receptor [Massilia eurypsychrophila]
MHNSFLTICLSGAALLHADAFAQDAATAPAKAPATAPAQVLPSVTVAGERPTNRIDRQVYDVRSDASSSNGTAADALNNVPSVAVDPDGSVTLRGSSNVQILVDGKPSAMLQGDNRGAGLQAMAADDIESVEVINNPGAQFGNEGGGGPILNMVMRRNRKPGGAGVANANLGSAGRYNSAVSGTYNEGAWGYQGGINVRHDGRNSTGTASRDRLDRVSGAMVHSTQQSVGAGLNDSVGVNGTVSYNIGANDSVSTTASFNGRSNAQQGRDRYIFDGIGGVPLSDYERVTAREGDSRNASWGARYDHKGALPGETLKFDVRVSSATNVGDSEYANTYAIFGPGMVNTQARQHNDMSNRIVDFTGDYDRPLAGGAAKFGYKLARNRSSSQTVYTDFIGGVGIDNPRRSSEYELEEDTAALFGSWQTRINERWGAQAGLRAEYTDLDIHQRLGSAAARNSYTNLMPSFFATYKVSDDSNLRFSYAHRLRRPSATDLNPAVIYRDDLNVFSGNPNLKPTRTDSFELGYETRMAGLETNLRGYVRRDTDAIVDYRYFLDDNVLLTTRANGAGSRAGGLEFTVSGKVTPTLTINANGNLARNELTSQDSLGVLRTRTANSLSARARLNYQYDAATSLQLALQMQGKTLSGQGYRSPSSTMNLSVRHVLTPQLTLVANVTDLFDTNKMATVVDSATLREISTRRFDGRILYVGLSYRFGGPAARAPEESSRQRGPGRGAGGMGRGMGPGGAGGPGPDGA